MFGARTHFSKVGSLLCLTFKRPQHVLLACRSCTRKNIAPQSMQCPGWLLSHSTCASIQSCNKAPALTFHFHFSCPLGFPRPPTLPFISSSKQNFQLATTRRICQLAITTASADQRFINSFFPTVVALAFTTNLARFLTIPSTHRTTTVDPTQT